MDNKEHIGLYFGSFNPVHTGHLIIAESIINNTDTDKIWFVVSPHNPLKEKSSLAEGRVRLEMLRQAVKDNPFFAVCDAEFSLPKPSYTVNTLAYLSGAYPDKRFSIIMGQDNLCVLDKWKDYAFILDNYTIYVYPRNNYQGSAFEGYKNIMKVDAPLVEISSTYIRNCIKQNKSIKYLVRDEVADIIEKQKLYLSE